MITIAQTVAASSATADLAYYVCIVSFFIAGGVAIYLLWDRIQKQNTKTGRARIVKPTKKAVAAKKVVAKKKTTAKKAPAKKSTKRTTKKK
jgi:membrane protein implicated in regulation of membrane protease activity